MISGYLRAAIAADGTTTNVPDPIAAPWEDLGRVYEGSDPQPAVSSRDDAAGRPVYGSAALVHTVELPNVDNYSTLKTYEDAGNPVVFALQKMDRTWEYYKNVRIAVRYMPPISASNNQNLRVYIYGAKHRINDMLDDDLTA